MKYFGKKSLSSVMSGILHVSWYVVLVVSIIGALIGLVLLFHVPAREYIAAEIARSSSFTCDMSSKDQKDWETFMNLPIFVRLIVVPYFVAVVVLLLKIIRRSQLLFTNFKNEIVFNMSNVEIISKLNKLLIVFSIMTVNFGALLVCVLLIMVCEIMKNGTALQEEHDLTV